MIANETTTKMTQKLTTVDHCTTFNNEKAILQGQL